MRLELSDNILLLATCIGLYVSFRTVFRQLSAIREETRISQSWPTSPRPRELDPHAEDEIDAETLHILSKSPNYELRNAAIKIFIDRAAQVEFRRLLLMDLRSMNSGKRQKAIKGLALLLYGVDLDDSERHKNRRLELGQCKETYKSLVIALINLQSEHKKSPPPPPPPPPPPQQQQQQQQQNMEPTEQNKSDGPGWMAKIPPSPIRPLRRSPQEFELMIMLTYMLGNYKSNAVDPLGTALQAGLVTKWLANYPFPCTLPEYSGANFKKSDVVTLFEPGAYETDDTLMGGLISLLTRDPRGMKELRNAGLTTSTFREDVRSSMRRRNWNQVEDMILDVHMNIRPHSAGRARPGTSSAAAAAADSAAGGAAAAAAAAEAEAEAGNGPRPRSVERSHEEDRLRRRHREAIVLAERDEPLSRENILQLQDSEMGTSPTGGPHAREGDDLRSLASRSSDASMPELEDIPDPSINRRLLNESPHSFRQRAMERQPWGEEGVSWASQDEQQVLFSGSVADHPMGRRLGNEPQGRRTGTAHGNSSHGTGTSYEMPD